MSTSFAFYFDIKQPIPTKLEFDAQGNVIVPACGQAQFYASSGRNANVCVTCDTGAEQSFIGEEALASIQGARSRSELKFWPAKTRILDASGNEMTLMGLALIELDIQARRTEPIPVFAVPKANFEVMIGQDWLKAVVRADILYSIDVIVFNDGPWEGCATKLHYRDCGMEGSVGAGIYLAANLSIGPRTAQVAPCKVVHDVGASDVIVEAAIMEGGLMVPRGYLSAGDDPYLLIVNPAQSRVTLREGIRLSTLSKVEEMEELETDRIHKRGTVASVGSVVVAHSEEGRRDVATQDEKYPNELNRDSAVRREKLSRLLEPPIERNMSESEWEVIQECVLANNDVFALSPEELTGTNWVKHHIETLPNVKPIRCTPRRLVESQKVVVKAEIDRLLSLGWIVPSRSPWASRIVMVKKKNGGWRMCIDYRGLNEVLKKDAYRLLNIEAILDALSGAKVFSVCDCLSGFHQIELANKASQEKTAFISQLGFFEWTRLPQGLANSPAEFQRLVDLLLAGIEFQFAICFIDDIIIFSPDPATHVQHLEEVFLRFRQANLKLTPSKCRIGCSRVEYLGHEIGAEGVKPVASKVAAIANFEVPQTVAQVATFLGVTGYYRKFIRAYAERSKNLRTLLHKDAVFQWTDACEEEFQDLRKTLASDPILRYPDFSKPWRLNTDASSYAVGAVLEQYNPEEPGKRWMVSCASRALVAAEKNYSTTDREALAIWWGIKHYRHYLLGRHFVVYTDHKPLLAWRSDKDLEGRRGKWMTQLQEYDFDIRYAKGVENVIPDLLSRWPDLRQPEENKDLTPLMNCALRAGNQEKDRASVELHTLETMVSELVGLVATTSVLREMQRSDAELQVIMQQLEEDRAMADEGYSLDSDSILRQDWAPKNDPFARTFSRVVLPFKLRRLTFEVAHEKGNHPGFQRLFETLRRRFYWPEMRKDLQIWCSWCVSCARRKPTRKRQRTPLVPMPAAGRFERVAMDVVGPLPETAQGNRFILTMIDVATRMVELHPLPRVRSEEVIRALLDWIARYGCCKQLLTDRGSNFLAEATLGVCRALGIQKKNTAAYHPQTNGAVEAFNKTVGDSLYYYSREVPSDWDLYIPFIAMHYRMTVHSQLRETPYLLTFGQEPRAPWDVLLDVTDGPEALTAAQLRRRAYEIQDVIEQRVEEQNARTKLAYDRAHRARAHPFKKGDWVMIIRSHKTPGVPKKFANRNDGPFVILSRVYDNDLAVRNANDETAEVKVVSADRLKLFRSAESVSHKQQDVKGDDVSQGNPTKSARVSKVHFVWAKVPGYEPWPARVISADEISRQEWPNKKWVRFFNDGGRLACVPNSRIFDYQEFRSEFLGDASASVLTAAEELEAAAGWEYNAEFEIARDSQA